MVHPVGAAIPIAGVAEIALDLVQHGVNPRGGGVVFVLLDQVVRGVPFAGQGQFNRLEQIFVRRVHGGVLLSNWRSGKAGKVTARLQILAARGPRGQRLRRPQPGLLVRGDGELPELSRVRWDCGNRAKR